MFLWQPVLLKHPCFNTRQSIAMSHVPCAFLLMKLIQKEKTASKLFMLCFKESLDCFDGLQSAETISRAGSAALLPEEMLQEGRGMSREHYPGQGPHPCLFVHMVGRKPANPMPRGVGIAPSWCSHGKISPASTANHFSSTCQRPPLKNHSPSGQC